MEYPQLPTNLKHASYGELSRAEMDLRTYKNATILTIRHWRAIPQLVESAKQVTKDQRRILREIKSRPEFHRVIMPSAESRAIIERHIIAKLQMQAQTEKLNIGDHVHSKFHNADGQLVNKEWSSRVGTIYHVRLENGNVVYVAREDLTKIAREA